MKRVGNLFRAFCSFENLSLAFRKARRGAGINREAGAFFFHAERELLHLQEELSNCAWQPRPYRYFEIYDPKHRTISVATFRDRVVHHALVNVLEPVFEKRFIHDSYATRKGKGVHAAVDRAQQFIRLNGWFFKSDIDKYFDSIAHSVLMALLEHKIKDRALLDVCERIIRNGGPSGKGLPIGNLTSQFLANVYLDPFDRFVKEDCRVRHYIRYMDDFVLFHPEKARLKSIRSDLADFLHGRLGLSLKPNATFLNSSVNGISFLGRRIFPATIRLHPVHLRRLTLRLQKRKNAFRASEFSEAGFLQSANSYWAMLSCHSTLPLRRALLAMQL